MSDPGSDLGPCPICGRPMVAGPSVDRHHWIPRKLGGRAWDWMHRICHKKLHSLYDERTLASALPDAASARRPGDRPLRHLGPQTAARGGGPSRSAPAPKEIAFRS